MPSTPIRHIAVDLGHVHDRLRLVVHRLADRSLERHLSERVRPAPAEGDSQAGPRASRGNSDDRLRLSGLASGHARAQAVLEPLGIRVETQFNALTACIVVGVMIIPLVSSLSEDVLSAVPRGLREAAYGLGATKFEVSTRIVLPAGLSGVFASFILAISRAVGETMAVVLAAGMLPQITFNPLTSIETMTTYIVQVISGEARTERPSTFRSSPWGCRSFWSHSVLNIISGLVLRRYREVYQ